MRFPKLIVVTALTLLGTIVPVAGGAQASTSPHYLTGTSSPAPADSVRATTPSAGVVDVSWLSSSQSASPARSYQISSLEYPDVTQTVAGDTTSVEFTGVPANQVITFAVIAINDAGASAPSYAPPVVVGSNDVLDCTVAWTGAVSNDWSDPRNWRRPSDTGSTLPTTKDVACIDPRAVRTDITISNSVSLRGINFGAANGLTPSVTVDWRGSLNVVDDSSAAISVLDAVGPITLGATTALRVDSLVSQTGGFTGPGTLILPVGSTSTWSGMWPNLDGGITVINQGTAQLTDGETMYFWGASQFFNLGGFTLGNQSDLCNADGSADAIVNYSSGNVTALGDASIHVPYSSGGYTVSRGNLDLDASEVPGVTDSGPFTVLSGGILSVNAPRDFPVNSPVRGEGAVSINSDSTLYATSTIPTILVGQGRLTIADGVTLNLSALRLNGQISGGSISTQYFTTDAGTSSQLVGTSLTVSSGGSLGEKSTLDLESSSSVVDAGKLTVGNGASINGDDGTSSFSITNSGSLIAGGDAIISVPLRSDGLIRISSGTVYERAGLTVSNVATTEIDVSPSGQGRLDASGGAQFGGTLQLQIDPRVLLESPTLIQVLVSTVLASHGFDSIVGLPDPSQGSIVAPTLSGSPGTQASAWSVTLLGARAALKVPPEFTSPNTLQVSVGQSFSNTISISSPSAFEMGVQGRLPDGVTLDGKTGILSGVVKTAGAYAFTVIVKSNQGVSSEKFILTVVNAPTITNSSTGGFVVGTAGSFTFTAAGKGKITITKTGALPAGITYDPATATLSGTAKKKGLYPLVVVAKSAFGTATQNFTLIVGTQPQFTSKFSTTVVKLNVAMKPLVITANGFPLPSFVVSGLPAGLRATDSGKGAVTINGTPTVKFEGPIVVTASNGVGNAAVAKFVLAVN